ncbi:MAG: tRNA lysidine(34) synthetase TilS [Planctomycetaceae bacterium]
MNLDIRDADDADPFVAEFVDRLGQELVRLSIRDCRVVLAVSGGADSTALLRGCALLRDELKMDIFVAHVNHLLRGEASDADEAWVNALSESLNIRFFAARIDVAAASAAARRGIEETARAIRYGYLKVVAVHGDSRFLLTAHTADDQAETILHHILRGTGMGGLKGIPSANVLSENLTLARPLKIFTRWEILSFLDALGQDFRTDESNADTGMTRNRIRLSLLPLLEQDFNREVKAALNRLGEQAEEVHDTLAILAERWFEPAIEAATSDSCRIDCEACAEIPPLIVREGLIRLWDRQNWPRQQMGAYEWREIERMIFNPTHPPLTLPGAIHAERRGTRLVLKRR